jgi:hypothetical protein
MCPNIPVSMKVGTSCVSKKYQRTFLLKYFSILTTFCQKLPTQQRRTPRKSTAKGCQANQIAFLDFARFPCLTQGDRHRCCRGVAIFLDIIPYLVVSQFQRFLHELTDAQIGLMRNQHIYILRR